MAVFTRRGFLIATAVVAGGGLALSWSSRRARRSRLDPDPGVLEPNAYLQVRPDGGIVVQVDKAELGQGILTAYVTLVAEELDVPPAAIEARLAPTHPLFQDPAQITSESKSTRSRWLPVRRSAAAAREMLVAEAAARWGVDAATLRTAGDGAVLNPATGARLGYAELCAGAATRPVPSKPQVRERSEFRWIGTRVPRVDVPAKVRGAAGYGLDVRVPGLLTAVIRRPPEFGAVLGSCDLAPAKSAPGVHDVFEVPTGIAVVGTGFWAVAQAAGRLEPRWRSGPLAGLGTGGVHAEQRRRLDAEAGRRVRDDGDPDRVFAKAGRVVEAEYAFPYLAHATMEPMNCTVHVRPDGAEVWAPNQGPDVVRQVVCDLTGLSRAQVEVHSTYAGGGFGRRSIFDFVAEAVSVARRVDAPVQLVFSREDDLRNGYYRQATVHRLRAALDDAGRPVAWSHRLAVAPLNELIFGALIPDVVPGWLPPSAKSSLGRGAGRLATAAVGAFQARDGSATMPYDVPNVAVELVEWDPGVPVGIWRSVANSYNAFAVETFVDELAVAAGADPAAFRRELLAAHPRHRAVLERLVRESGWGHAPPGRHLGLALHACNLSVVGQVAEVSVTDGAIRVHRVTCAIDCGLAVNPDIVRQQMEGGIVFGLTAALYGEMTLEQGRMREGNFDAYRMVTLADAPAIDVHIVDTGAPLGGVGEPGVPPIAPAVANAVYRATGKRLRQLPLRV